ncbi:MAG: MFS transporter, partial [Methylocystaceae bacterium]
ADTCGAKKNMYVGALLYGVGWFFTGRCETLTQLYLVYGVIAGSGGGTIYNAVISTTLRWFPDIRGKVTGFLLAASALGPFTLAPLSAVLVQKFGIVRTFEILGVLFFIAITAVGWMLESAPVNYKPVGWNPEPNSTVTASPERDYQWKEMLSTPIFYVLLVIYACASTAGTMMINSASVMAQTQIGAAATLGALIVSVSTLSNFTGRLSFGAIYDKIGGFKSLLLSFSLTIIALLLIGRAHAMSLFIICVILLGFAFGGLLVVFPPITGQHFGIKNLGVNYGIIFLGYAGGSFIGPRVSSYFLDATGSFSMAYLAAAALAALGAVLVVVILISGKKAVPTAQGKAVDLQ